MPVNLAPCEESADQTSSRRIFFLAFALTMCGALLSTLGRNVQDSDSLTTAFISTQKLTWYYWGQNRFGNLLPFLAAWIAPIKLNLLFQVFLRAVCGFLSIFFVLELIGDRERMVERFALAIILLTTCSQTYLRFVEPFAQPTSTAVFVLGLWLNRIKAPSRVWRVFQALAITILFWISFWVNISLPILVLPLLGAFWRVGIEIRLYRRAFFTALVAALGAYVHSQFFYPKTPIVFVFDMQSISAALTEVQSEIFWERLLIFVLVVFCLIVVVSIARQRVLPSVLALPLAHALTLCVAAGNIVFFASVQHVQTNGNAVRYYIVPMIIYEVTLASWIFSALLSTVVSVMPRILKVFIRYALPISALGFVLISVGPPKPMRFASDIADKKFAVNADATMVADFVKTDRPLVVVGDDYWLVEPILFVAVQRMNKLVPAHAITAHWEPMRGEVGRLVRTAPMLTIVCIQIAAVDCSGKLHDTAGVPHDSRSNTIEHEGSLDSGGSYLVVSSALRE